MYAHENGCEWNAAVCSEAAKSGELKCLMYAHQNGCSWNAGTTVAAASGGSLTCLKYAHENGCAWLYGRMCEYAAKGGNLKCLIYVYKQERRWSRNVNLCVATSESANCFRYVFTHGGILSSEMGDFTRATSAATREKLVGIVNRFSKRGVLDMIRERHDRRHGGGNGIVEWFDTVRDIRNRA